MTADTPLGEIFRLSPVQKTGLKKLGLIKVLDLLYHFPTRYGDTAEIKPIASLGKGSSAVLFGRISSLKTAKGFHTKIAMAEGFLEDETGKIKLLWFNQPYIAKMIAPNSIVRVEGKVSDRKGELYISNPKIEKIEKMPTSVGDSLFGSAGESHSLYPIYPETRGLTSNWIYHAIQKIFKAQILEKLDDPIPQEILSKYNLPSIKSALIWIHAPLKEDDAISARKRFAFEEVFFIQLEKQKSRLEFKKNPAFVIEPTKENVDGFTSRFPFKPTEAQSMSINAIFNDFKKGQAMSRLLEGDVGSGKTFVAATTTYAVTTTRPKGQTFGALQTAYMCPTEILAKQHFESFIKFFSHLPIQIGLITGSGCQKFPSKVSQSKATKISRAQLLKWVANGEIPILVGTHALIQKSVKFKNLAYVIIDEQHRFGVSQRKTLARGHTQTETLTYADKKIEKDVTNKNIDFLIYKDITYTVRNIVFAVRKALGLGHKELVYQRAIEEELKKRNIAFSREKQIPILYNKKKIGVYVPDFVIENKIILELKALPFVGAREKKQLWTYLKGSEYALALLVNFGHDDVHIERIVYQTARESASSQVVSALRPHLLSMTATPIPRTLALTIFGDLDLTLLDQMPAGRKPIITEIIMQADRKQTYEKIRAEIKKGRQAYVICPRIDEPDPEKEMAIIAKSVTEEALRLKKEVFPEYEIGVLHGKMKPVEKDKVMAEFTAKKTQILVATSVIEVGVNVPNATVIVIEGAERFGLAQLHQLRGRVIRSNDQAYCYVFTETQSKKTVDRLHALKTAKNGFELAEFDLQQRGAGELSGIKQWGVSDIAMEALRNIKMVEAARIEALNIIETDSEYTKYPQIKRRLADASLSIHFE